MIVICIGYRDRFDGCLCRSTNAKLSTIGDLEIIIISTPNTAPEIERNAITSFCIRAIREINITLIRRKSDLSADQRTLCNCTNPIIKSFHRGGDGVVHGCRARVFREGDRDVFAAGA